MKLGILKLYAVAALMTTPSFGQTTEGEDIKTFQEYCETSSNAGIRSTVKVLMDHANYFADAKTCQEASDYLEGVSWLGFMREEIHDLRPFAKFANLKTLFIHKLRDYNIDVLKSLTNLKRLELVAGLANPGNPGISNIEVIRNFPNLVRLDLPFNNISDLSPVQDLPYLTRLTVSHNNLDDEALNALAGLENLTFLALSSNNLSDVSALASLPNLKRLELYGNDIEKKEATCPTTGVSEPLKKFCNL